MTGKEIDFEYSEKNRIDDHICYISDISKLKDHFPSWGLTRKFDDILEEMVEFELRKLNASKKAINS